MAIFRPTYLIEGDVTDIDLDQLYADGIRGLIFDLDSTLLAPRTGHLTEDVERWVQKARTQFQVAIVSNNKREAYIELARKIFDMPTIGRAAKPRRRAFLQALDFLQLKASEVAVIGDRPLTDIWGGQRAGMKTVLVWPLKSMNEPGWVTFFRKLERRLIRS